MKTPRLLLAVVLAAAALAAAALTSASAPPADIDRRKPFALVLPELGPQAITATEAVIPHANLTRLRLRVYKPFADTIRYGKIYTKINGESANTVFNFNSDSDGYVINGDLRSKPRFALRPGKNVVEINAKADDGREYYASYVLLTADRRAGDTGIGADTTVETAPVASGADRSPPVGYLTRPSGPLMLNPEAASVKLAGVVVDDSSAVASVTVNGRAARLEPYTRTRGAGVRPGAASAPEPPDDFTNASQFEAVAPAGAGVTSIVLEAKDAAGNLTRLTIPLRRRSAAVSAGFKGRKFALVVGVSKYMYHDARLRNLAYADEDARAVSDFLTQPEGGGFAPEDIRYLENEKATVEAVRAELTGFLPRAGPDDIVFIYLAGHGDSDPNAPQNLYFILHDTKREEMPSTALPMTELQEVIVRQLRARRVVAFIDTCHSAGLTGEKPTARGVENNLINLYASKLFAETGRAVITASDVSELSEEDASWGGGHGAFTWALLEGLRGAADEDADRYITAGELFGYVSGRVRSLTRFRQNPQAMPGINEDLALAYVTYRKRDR